MFLMTNKEDAQPKKKKKRKKRKGNAFLNFLKVFFLLFFIVAFVGTAAVGAYAYYVIANAEPIDPTRISEMLDDTSFIYDSQGNLLEKVAGVENRTVVKLDQMPDSLKEAVVAIEDERFYEHKGIDIKRIFGALWHDIKTMSLEQGASTLTMQLAKNLYTSSTRSFDRKITDAYYALQIEKILSKDQILFYYLNHLNLGRGNYGVQAAANHYFDKDVSELTLAESAMLAGISKNPSRYSVYTTSPIEDADDLDTIQIRLFLRDEASEVPLPTEADYPLFDRLLAKGLISRYEYAQLKNGDYYVRKATLNPTAKERQELVLQMMKKNGYIDEAEYQAAVAEEIVVKIGKNKQSNISSYFADKVKVETIAILQELGHDAEKAQDILVNGGLRIYSTMDPKIQAILETEINNSANYPRTRTDEDGVLQPQVAAVIMDHSTGFVRGLIGGRGISGSKIYNRALNPRQPGSSIKPIAVYLPALSHGFTAASPVDDSPITEGNYKPKNYSSYDGPTTVRNLIIKSSNVGAVRVAQEIGVSVMINSLRNLGISTVVTSDTDRAHNDENLSLALGGMTLGVTPLDMTAAYATIANDGTYIKPIFVKRIETSTGSLVYEAKAVTRKVATPQEAYIMKSMLQDVVNRGTGARAKVSSQATAGKTGTTNDEKDVWFVGFTPYYAGAVWIGEDLPKDLNMTSDVPSALWGKIMNKVHSDLPGKSFTMPSNIVGLTICNETGLQATPFCPNTRKEIFIAGTTPKEICPLHEETPPEENPLLDDVTDDNGETTDPTNPGSGGETTDPGTGEEGDGLLTEGGGE